MRVALISLPAGEPSPTIAGKTLAERQLDFALAAGAERVVLKGDGASPDAIGLRHVAERAGARFQAVRDSHGLLGAVSTSDELLVIGAGVLPEAPQALDSLRQGTGVLVLPAPAGVSAGFERIDLERAWAGVLAMPGGLVERLAELPPDSETAPALLRIALGARLRDIRLPDGALADGSWAMIQPGESQSLTRRWVGRHLPPSERYAPARQAARYAVGLFGPRLLAPGPSDTLLQAGALALLIIAMGLGWFGFSAVAFATIAAATLVAALSTAVAALRNAPFLTRVKEMPWREGLAALTDMALIVCTVGAIEGSWPHRLFAPLILMGGLRTRERTGSAALLEDRTLLALLLMAAAIAGRVEWAVMLLALLVIAHDAAKTALVRG